MKTLVLFDIDGTILKSGGAGRIAMERALVATFGTPGDPAYHYDGKTDRQIIRELMRHAGFSDTEIDDRMPLMVQRDLEAVRETLAARADRVILYGGVASLIDRVHERDEMILGLLTGNVEPGAHLK